MPVPVTRTMSPTLGMMGSICWMRAVAPDGLLTATHLTWVPSNAGLMIAISSTPQRDSDDPDAIPFAPGTHRRVDTWERAFQIRVWCTRAITQPLT